MGFSMEMIVLRPEKVRYEDEAKQAVVWKPHAVITGYASWGNAERGEVPTGLSLAELCLTSWIYQRLISYVGPKPTRRYFAPCFAMPEELKEDEGFAFRNPLGWLEARQGMLADGEQVILPLWHWDRKEGFPSSRARSGHNAIIGFSRPKYTLWRKSAIIDPMNSPPFFWLPNSVVAYWISELEQGSKDISQQLLKKDKMATSIVRARRLYLEELGRADCRILFSFQGRIGLEYELI